MGGSPRTIGLAVVAAVLAAGCSSLSSAGRPAPAEPGAASPAEATADIPAGGSDPEALRQVMGELHELGTLDPAAQARLMEDLSQTDPTLWPMVTQQFRAAVAYRRRAEAGRPEGADHAGPSPMQAVWDSASPGGRGGGQAVEPASGWEYPPPVASPGGGPAEQPARLPAADNAALTPPSAPADGYPATVHPEPDAYLANRPTDLPSRQALQEWGNRSGSDAWQAQLDGAIRSLESQLRAGPATPDRPARHAQLRMLYLLAGRRDDALQAIPSIPVAEQDFWSKELYALATWLDTERSGDGMDRAAETKQVLEEAALRLGESAPLAVRNLAFCTEVRSYGCIERFKTYEFVPGQEVLLYAEVDNFASQPTAKGFHTSLRSSYQIFDSRGQRVADHQFASTEEYCQNARRDFFIGYHIYLPNRVYPGRHTLQLTIEDLRGHKVGQSSIELTIKDAGG